MHDLLIWSLEKARKQTLNLVEDLQAEQMCLQTAAGENHCVLRFDGACQNRLR